MFSKNIRNARIKAGLTISEAADQIGIAYSTYAGYEIGHREHKLEILQKISKAFKVSVDDLLDIPPLTSKDIPLSDNDDTRVFLSNDDQEYWKRFLSNNRNLKLFRKYSMLTESAQDRVDATVNDIWSNPANRIDQQPQGAKPITYTIAAKGGDPGLESGMVNISQEEYDRLLKEAQMAQDLEDWG